MLASLCKQNELSIRLICFIFPYHSGIVETCRVYFLEYNNANIKEKL